VETGVRRLSVLKRLLSFAGHFPSSNNHFFDNLVYIALIFRKLLLRGSKMQVVQGLKSGIQKRCVRSS